MTNLLWYTNRLPGTSVSVDREPYLKQTSKQILFIYNITENQYLCDQPCYVSTWEVGIIIDDQLKWSTHIETVYRTEIKVSYRHLVHTTKYAINCLTGVLICNIYFGFVHPYILYGLEVYGNTYAS